jgi:hypothetical protein
MEFGGWKIGLQFVGTHEDGVERISIPVDNGVRNESGAVHGER